PGHAPSRSAVWVADSWIYQERGSEERQATGGRVPRAAYREARAATSGSLLEPRPPRAAAAAGQPLGSAELPARARAAEGQLADGRPRPQLHAGLSHSGNSLSSSTASARRSPQLPRRPQHPLQQHPANSSSSMWTADSTRPPSRALMPQETQSSYSKSTDCTSRRATRQ
ncbi:unnamed protein product, partial [Prorocentrum cordatum]